MKLYEDDQLFRSILEYKLLRDGEFFYMIFMRRIDTTIY